MGHRDPQYEFDFESSLEQAKTPAIPQNEDPEIPAGATPQERFRLFHKKNPHVYLAVVSLAKELKRQGMKKIGMKMIFEQLRWNYKLQTRGDKWNFNNNYTAFYARLVLEKEPELQGLFELRRQRCTS